MNLIETGDHQVNADSDPDLCAHGVLGGAEESFNTEVLLDPFKEKFDLPPTFVNGCDSQGGQLEVIGEKDKSLAAHSIHVTDTPERFGVIAFPLPCANWIVWSHRRPVVLLTGRDLRTLNFVLLFARMTKKAFAISIR